jgi:hypothetical protein
MNLMLASEEENRERVSYHNFEGHTARLAQSLHFQKSFRIFTAEVRGVVNRSRILFFEFLWTTILLDDLAQVAGIFS